MNMNKVSEEERFSVEDIVSYSNIEITHVNDNKMPNKLVVARFIVWLILGLMLVTLFAI